MRTIIEMAREAGIRDVICDGTKGCLGRFAAFVRADEREACAKVCDEVGQHPSLTPRHCAEAIRERGNPPIAADPKAFHGFPDGPVSTPNAGGKCVTAGETAPKEST